MTRNQLRAKLVAKGVHEGLYSLDGLADQSECYSLLKENGDWRVLYKERGQVTEIASGLTESEACRLVYNKFKKAFGWRD